MDGISILLPVYNQSNHLTKAVSIWQETVEKLKRPYEIIVINDGSSDSTRDTLSTMQANPKYSNLQIFHHETRRGYGASLRTALPNVQKELIVLTSLRYPYQPEDLRKLLDALKQKNELTGQQVAVVNGCRLDLPYVGGAAFRGEILRYGTRILFGHLPEKPQGLCSQYSWSRWWRLRLQFGLKFHDTFSEFKIIRREVLERMELQSDSEFLLAEILAKATFLGFLMDEVPIAQNQIPMPWGAEPELPELFRKDRSEVFRKQKFKQKLRSEDPPCDPMLPTVLADPAPTP